MRQYQSLIPYYKHKTYFQWTRKQLWYKTIINWWQVWLYSNKLWTNKTNLTIFISAYIEQSWILTQHYYINLINFNHWWVVINDVNVLFLRKQILKHLLIIDSSYDIRVLWWLIKNLLSYDLFILNQTFIIYFIYM